MASVTLKQRFVEAILRGELGRLVNGEVIVTLKEFKAYFSDIKSQYVTSFLPAATFEPGQFSLTPTKFVFRVRKGVYRVHAGLFLRCDKDKDNGFTANDSSRASMRPLN